MTTVFLTLDQSREMSGRYIDCRFNLTLPDWGLSQFDEGHIKGAIFADLDRDLSSVPTEKTGRHPLPHLQDFVEWIQLNGINDEHQYFIYDNFKGGIAARLWLMLKQVGIESVYILTESIEEWINKGYETETEIQVYPRSSWTPNISSWEEGIFELKELREIAMLVPSNYLIDSRAVERFKGEEEPYDSVAGHIPGAVSLPWMSHLEGSLIVADRSKIGQVIDLSGLSEYTVYCGSGVTACFNIAVMEHLNLPRPKLYVGSYSEWSRNYPDQIETSIE